MKKYPHVYYRKCNFHHKRLKKHFIKNQRIYIFILLNVFVVQVKCFFLNYYVLYNMGRSNRETKQENAIVIIPKSTFTHVNFNINGEGHTQIVITTVLHTWIFSSLYSFENPKLTCLYVLGGGIENFLLYLIIL